MSLNYRNLLSSLNLSQETVSARLRKRIAEFDDFEASVNNARALAEQGNQEAIDDLLELENDYLTMHEGLCKEIQKFHKNKDHYAALANNLAKKREENAANNVQPTNTATVIQMPQQQPNAQTVTKSTNEPQKNNIEQKNHKDQNEPPKKKSNIVYWVLGIATAGVACWLGINTLQVPPFKKK